METIRKGDVAKQLSAYRLGLHSQMLSTWHALFIEKPEFEWGTADGVLVTIEQMSEAVLALATEIPVNLYGELRSILGHQEDSWTKIVAAGWETQTGGLSGNRDARATAEPDPSPPLRPLLTAVFKEVSVLRPWFRLGEQIGACHQTVDKREAPSIKPQISGIVAAARNLPTESTILIPVLDILCDGRGESAGLTPRAFLTRVIESACQRPDYEMFGENFDGFVIGELLLALDQIIQDQFCSVAESKVGTAENKAIDPAIKPEWVKAQGDHWVGELRLGTCVIRKVRQVAKNIIVILDVFQEEGWPPSIDDPVPGASPQFGDPQKRHEAIRSLNKTLTLIRFYGDGSNSRIAWKRI